ncbi:MAG: hypothetical protein DRP55_02220 [Spirochaetes bacterium]|nr:MAG: hypothetical protein DRP55_02220 [Spirochaetota bacterium]
MKKIVVFILILLIGCPLVYAAKVREPAASGTFYPEDDKVLKRQIDKFLDKAKEKKIQGKLVALIVPHAGYIYSGGVAAYGYKLLKGKTYDTVIIIGPSHYTYFKGISIYNGDYYKTPLGKVAIDKEITDYLLSNAKNCLFYEPAHKREHSVEVEVPFLQRMLSDFKMVSVVVGDVSYQDAVAFSDVLCRAIKKQNKKILIIASTDLSHYHNYHTAINLDNETINTILSLEPVKLMRRYRNKEVELCGLMPVVITEVTSNNLGARAPAVLLKYANSGDVTFSTERVVGYASIAILKDEGGDVLMLTDADKKRLIEIARESIRLYLEKKRQPTFDIKEGNLLEEKGAFVTIKIDNNLRGCIGRIIADGPLYQTISEMAIQAAFNDPRFPPLTKEEFKDIEIEISILSKLKRIHNIDEIEVGRHGILIKKGFYQGLLLPQVATEYNWDRNTFLEHTCYKAGLSKYAWKDDNTEIYVFSAEVFSESKLR